LTYCLLGHHAFTPHSPCSKPKITWLSFH
jgi:hypothetical protein